MHYDGSWPPFWLPLFRSDGLHVYLYALTSHFGHWVVVGRQGRKALRWQVAKELIYGQVKKSYRRRKLARVIPVMRLGTQDADPRRLTGDRLLRPAEHRLYRAGESDGPTWGSSARPPHVGHLSTGSTAARPSGVVARLLSFCP